MARRLTLVAAYVAPAVGVWMLVGWLLNLFPISAVALIGTALYAIMYGITEATGRTYPAAPTIMRQVPSAWVRHANPWQRILIWGSILGPGFVTINPYAGFALLALTLASIGNLHDAVIVAASIGALHGIGRSLALLRDVRGWGPADYKEAMRRQKYWRKLDGVLLLVIGGIAVAAFIHRFS
jgi:hypothetical protein